MNKKIKILNKLKAAPPSNNQDYTIYLRDLVLSYNYRDLFRLYIPIIENEEYSMDIRFAAYYSSSIFFRRNDKFEEMINLSQKYSSIFAHYPLNDVVVSFKYRYMALDYHSEELMNKAIIYASSAKNKIEHHKAILHHYSETVAIGLEYDLINFNDKDLLIEDALASINESIMLWSSEPIPQKYAKNYSTLGRLYIQKGKYDLGISYISKSLNYEDGEDKHSLRRIFKYNNYLFNAQFKKSISLLHIQEKQISEQLNIQTQNLENKLKITNEAYENQIKEIINELNANKLQSLEFLAFFSSIIAILTCSTSIIANSENFYIATCLILILGGVIIFSFSVFSLIFEIKYQNEKRYFTFIIIILLSACFILSGILLGFHFINWNLIY